MMNVNDWYWIIAGDASKVFSSASGAYLQQDAAAYVSWLGLGNQPTRLASEAELLAYLAINAPNVSVQSPAGLKAYAARARYNRETGGTTLGGAAIASDRASQAMVTGAYVQAQGDANFSTQWKQPDGSFVTLTAAQIMAIGQAVLTHVSACFAAEAQAVAAIDAGTATTAADIDAFFASIV